MTGLRVYVAGAGRDLQRVEAFVASMQLRGHVLAHDWLHHVRAASVAGQEDKDLPDVHAARMAQGDLEGLIAADAFVLLAPGEGGSGAWTEFGFALAIFQGPVVVAGPHARRSVFTRLAAALAVTDEAALDLLDELGRAQAAVDAESATWACVVCGCTNDRPCEGGCAWVAPRLCSRCADESDKPGLIAAGR